MAKMMLLAIDAMALYPIMYCSTTHTYQSPISLALCIAQRCFHCRVYVVSNVHDMTSRQDAASPSN